MERFVKKIEKYNDFVELISNEDPDGETWYEILISEYGYLNRFGLSQQDFAELMISGVLDIAKRCPDA